MIFSAGTDIGRIRSSNQDCFDKGDLPDGGAWAIVCDGMGGHAGGNVASETAVKRMAYDIKNNYRKGMSRNSVRNMLVSAINCANADIRDKASEDVSLNGMGTTVVAVICNDNKALVAHVGDSRCYLIRNGEISGITKDHSYVQQLVDAGYITADQAQTHPQKNIITRALGIGDELDIDFSEVNLESGDKLLLCTDGLTNHASDDEILSCVSDDKVSDYSNRLITLANSNGGSDNITAVVIAV